MAPLGTFEDHEAHMGQVSVLHCVFQRYDVVCRVCASRKGRLGDPLVAHALGGLFFLMAKSSYAREKNL